MTESPQATPFGQYQLIEKIAQGGMAEIFKGKALDLHGIERVVVIKRILPHIAASPEFIEMLIDEAKINVMLSHGNIAQIYDLGKVADDYFIVMEYVEGKTLSQIMKRLRIQEKQIPIACAVALTIEIANGLDYMHRKTDDRGDPLHIVHRDISPQNIILSTAGTVKIIDFGIAKARTKVSTTDSGVLKGKFAYMSPEHAEGERLDFRTDIFSLGIVLFELLTGQRLFKAKNNAETIRKIKKTKVPDPSGIRPTIPKSLSEIILKALRKNRDKRYQSAHDFSRDMTKYLVTHHPEFLPRDLIRFLNDLFPEAAAGPKEDESSRTSPAIEMTSQPTQKNAEEEDPFEATVQADSDVIRAKLKETEVFDVPDREDGEHPGSPQEESAEKVVIQQLPSETVSKGFTVRALVLIGTGILILAGAALFRLHHQSQTEAPSQPGIQPIAPPQDQPAPAPAPPPQARPKGAEPPILLTRKPALGSISMASEPPGARIFLNDTDTNQVTPALLAGISPLQPQKISLSLDHYKFWEGKAQVQSGETLKLSIPLEINYGDLEIDSLPAGAEVQLNGRKVGATPYQMGRIRPETAFDIALTHAGYETWTGKIKIFGGRKEVVSASLKKIPLN